MQMTYRKEASKRPATRGFRNNGREAFSAPSTAWNVTTDARGFAGMFDKLAPIDRYGPAAREAAHIPALERAAVTLCHLGRGGLIWHGLALALGVRSPRLRRLERTGAVSATIAAAFGLSTMLARVTARPRPCRDGVASAVPCPDGGSFPSDQAAAAFAAAGSLPSLAPELRMPLSVAAAAFSAARVAVGVHHPTDVIAGALLGAATARAGVTVVTRLSSLPSR